MHTKGCALQTAFPDQAAKTIRNQLKKQRRLFNPLFSCQDIRNADLQVCVFHFERSITIPKVRRPHETYTYRTDS